MKKLVSITALCMSIVGAAVAQDSSESDNRDKIQIGLKAGINYANVYDASGDQFKADGKVGFVGGGFVAIPIIKLIGIQPEILFSQKGFISTGQLLGSEYSLTRTTNYLDIPLLFALKPFEFLTILAGPQYSFLFSQNDSFKSSLVSFSQEQTFKQDNIRHNILGIAVGADVNIKHINVAVRASWDVINNQGDGTSNTPRYKNAVIQLTLGYKIY